MRYLLDTDWVIHYLNAHQGIVERLHGLIDEGLGLSIISLAELYEGVYYSSDPEGDEQDLNNFLRGTTAIHHDLTLLSNNRRHFDRIEGLRIESA
jgi:predicted nucleic acid-binding protein